MLVAQDRAVGARVSPASAGDDGLGCEPLRRTVVEHGLGRERRAHGVPLAQVGAEVVVSSLSLGWPGLLVEAGRNNAWEVDDLTVAHHYPAMNPDVRPLRFEVKGARGFCRVTLDPGSAWVCPAGEPFRHRVGDPNAYALVAVAPARLDRLAPPDGGAVALRPAYDVRPPQLEHLVRALAVSSSTRRRAAVRRRAHPGPRAADGADGGRGGAPAAQRGAEPGARRARVQAVRRAPPHRHLLALRLERARRLVDAADARLSAVALRVGFADEAHFTCAFRRAFGVTAGAARRSRLTAR